MQRSDARRDINLERVRAEMMQNHHNFAQLSYDTNVFLMNLREGRTSYQVLDTYIKCFPPYTSSVLRVCHQHELVEVLTFIAQIVM